jgi:hypothetical protein
MLITSIVEQFAFKRFTRKTMHGPGMSGTQTTTVLLETQHFT